MGAVLVLVAAAGRVEGAREAKPATVLGRVPLVGARRPFAEAARSPASKMTKARRAAPFAADFRLVRRLASSARRSVPAI